MKEYDGVTDYLRLYFKEIGDCGFLTKEEEQELAPKIKKGNIDASNRLALGCIQYVVSEALKRSWSGLPLADLIGEGNVGLIIAARKYDGEKYDNRFIAYARWWIRHRMDEAIKEHYSILKVKAREINQIIKIKKAASRLEQILGGKPSITEIAEFTGLPEEVIGVRELMECPVYLDESESDDDRRNDELIGDQQYSGENIYDMIESREIADIINTLTERQAKVIIWYYGLNGEQTRTFEEIGELLGGITGERAKQIRNKGLERLRDTARGRYLKEFL